MAGRAGHWPDHRRRLDALLFRLNYLPVSLVVTLSNLYIVVTIVLGIVVLHEPVTVLKIAGLACIVAGVVLLGHSPARYAAHPSSACAACRSPLPPRPRTPPSW